MRQDRVAYQGKIIEIIEFSPDGNRTFEMARRAPGTRLIVRSHDMLLLTREYRREVNAYDYRLPGGKVFDKLSEYNDFLATNPSEEQRLGVARAGAVKELEEEVGLRVAVKDLDFIYKSVCGATVEWDLYYFVVNTVPEQLGKQQLEEGEDISLVRVSLAEAKEIALDPNKMSEDRSVSALLRYLETAIPSNC